MGAMLRLIHMDTTLQGPMFMHTLEPMSMRIHPGIMSPIIIPIEREVRRNTSTNLRALLYAPVYASGVASNVRAQELQKGSRCSRTTFPGAFDQADLTDSQSMDGDGHYPAGPYLVHYCYAWHNRQS